MTFKLSVLAFVGMIMLVLQATYTTVVQPEIATSVALEQFADPSIAVDTVQRNFQRWGNLISSMCWLTYLGLGFLWIRKTGESK